MGKIGLRGDFSFAHGLLGLNLGTNLELESVMKRLRGSVPVAAALLAVTALAASGVDAKPRHKPHHTYAQRTPGRSIDFPTYVDHGSDRNPGMENLYFTDTRNPGYELGPSVFQKYEDK